MKVNGKVKHTTGVWTGVSLALKSADNPAWSMASLSGVGSGELVTTVKKLKSVSQEKGNQSFDLLTPEIFVKKSMLL